MSIGADYWTSSRLRLRFLWQISPDRTPQPDPAQASEVEVRFTPSTSGETSVRLVHSGFERYGEAGAAYRAEMGSEYGWRSILARFADHAGRA